MKRIAKVLDIDGNYQDNPDFPVAVVRGQEASKETGQHPIVDPVFNHDVTRNLFGRIMTLVEATCESHKLKSVKDLFAKELGEWETEVYRSARELAEGGNSSTNIYTRGVRKI